MTSARVTAEELQQGGDEVFARFFEQNRETLLALAYRLTSSKAEAQDVVQDAFVSILLHHDRFRCAAQPTTWAHRVTVNAALMRLRSARRKRTESLDDDVEERLCADDVVPDPARATKRAVLDRALARLSDLDRTVVQLRFVDELSTEEVAQRMGLTTSAVKTRLHRARQRLQLDDELQAFT